jgi:hypothetical protein
VEAEDGSANVFLTGPGIDVEKRLAYGHDQKEDCEQETEARILIREAVPKIEHYTEANAEQRCALQEAQGARQLAACILHEHRRRQDAGDSRTSLRSDGYTPNFLKNESNAVQMPPPEFRRFCICVRCAASRAF